MKKNLTLIVRIVMTAVIMFGVQTTANAQLGKLKGLADKAKSAAKEKVEKKVNQAKNDVQQTVQQQATQQATQLGTQVTQPDSSTDDPEEMSNEELIRRSQENYQQQQALQQQMRNPQPKPGQVLIINRKGEPGQMVRGRYDKATRVFVTNRDPKVAYKWAEDGRVLDTQGTQIGSISQTGEMTNQRGDKFMVKDNKVYVNSTVIGTIDNDTTATQYPGYTYVTTEPMDKMLTCFILFGLDNATQLETAAKNASRIDKENDEFFAFAGRAQKVCSRQSIENPNLKGEMDSRDYYKFNQQSFGAKDNGVYWVWMDDRRVCGYNPVNNHLVDDSRDWTGTWSGGVIYNRQGKKLGAVSSAGVCTNAAGKMVGKIVKGSFQGTAFSAKGKTFNYKLVDAAGKQVGLVEADANPNLVAAWAFFMFAKK